MELFLEGLFACFNHSEPLKHLTWISVSGFQVKMTDGAFTRQKQPLDIDEKDLDNILWLEIIIRNLIFVT